MTFEEAMAKLNDIVTKLETSKIDLESSLKLFEEGTELVAFCNKKLEYAQDKINELIIVKEPAEQE